jgi:hypothetical protein
MKTMNNKTTMKAYSHMTTTRKRNGYYSHHSGEALVEGELFRRGYIASRTNGNAKGIDLFVTRDGIRPVAVQVKAMKDKKSIGWTLFKKDVQDNVRYVLVNLNAPSHVPAAPAEYYICTPQEARCRINDYNGVRGSLDLSKVNSDEFHNRWDKIESVLIG